MAKKVIRFSQEIPSNQFCGSDKLTGTDDMSTPLNNGEVRVIFVPENLSRCCGLRSSIGECLWSDRSNFRNLFAKEIHRVVRYVRTPSLTIVLHHKTLGGELLTVQYRMTEHDMYGLAGIPAPEDESDTVFDLCLDITDRMVLQLIDSMSFNIKPSYSPIDTIKPVVPYDGAVDNFISWRNKCDCVDGTALTPEQSNINDLKTEVEDIRNKMMETIAVPADRLSSDYELAKKIVDKEYHSELFKSVTKESSFKSITPEHSGDEKTEKSKDEDSMFETSKKSWI